MQRRDVLLLTLISGALAGYCKFKMSFMASVAKIWAEELQANRDRNPARADQFTREAMQDEAIFNQHEAVFTLLLCLSILAALYQASAMAAQRYGLWQPAPIRRPLPQGENHQPPSPARSG